MHEWALAEGVIQTTIKIASEQGLTKVTEVTIEIGELQQVEEEVFQFALENLRTPLLKEAIFRFVTITGKLKCRVCGQDWVFSPKELEEDVSEAIHFIPEVAHVYISCPKCNSPDFEVIEGRGVILASIKGVREDD